MSYPVRQKRTIRDVSHHFLSQVPSISTVRHSSIIGCYLAKGVMQAEQAVQLILESRSTEGRPAQVCNLHNSSLTSLLSKTFQSVPFSPDKFQSEVFRKGSSTAMSVESAASAYYFIFREDDCLVLDAVASVLGAVILVGDASGKDLTELYKVVKGFRNVISTKRWFLCFHPELTVSSTRLAVQQFNKITRAFLSVEVTGWHSNGSESLQIWRDENLQLGEETISRQGAFSFFIDQQVSVNGNFSQGNRS